MKIFKKFKLSDKEMINVRGGRMESVPIALPPAPYPKI